MKIEQFFAIGINHKKSDASVRSGFAVNSSQYVSLLQKALQEGIQELFVLSTCNRTEIYCIAPDPDKVIDLLCNETGGDTVTFLKVCYIKQGMKAVEHLFCVGAGLDSQILGDYEIVGQLKQAVTFAREWGFIGPFIDRLFNTVLQAAKLIKNKTALSTGTVSVSFAAIQFLKSHITEAAGKKIVLLGTGKIGRITCKNLIDYLEVRNITVINRTEDKATGLALELGLRVAPYENMHQEIQEADIVIVATNSDKVMITRKDLLQSSPKILIDLSIPNNIESSAGTLQQITLVNVDDLSLINDKTLVQRRADVPKAMEILKIYITEFMQWHGLRSHVPVLKAVKQKLQDMHSCGLLEGSDKSVQHIDESAIQKVVNGVAKKLLNQYQPGCCYIEAINEFLNIRSNFTQRSGDVYPENLSSVLADVAVSAINN